MNKKIKLVIVVAIALLGFANLNSSNISNTTSSIELTNILALASANAEGGLQLLSCYKQISSGGSGNLTHVTYCQDCDARLARSWSSKYSCQP